MKYYNVKKIIGKGSFAKVILANRKSDNKQFAVKTFDKRKIYESKNFERTKLGIINEIYIMRNIDHPNIIKLHEIYEGDNHIYLILDLLNGGELFQQLKKKCNYSEKEAFDIIIKLLLALDYLHGLNIMHRDIKPENLILKDEKNISSIVLVDLGLAEFNSKNKIFTRCGTPGYVAPEVMDDVDYGLNVDVFSAGIILYILLSGCSAFSGKNIKEILYKNINCNINWNFEKINVKISNDGNLYIFLIFSYKFIETNA